MESGRLMARHKAPEIVVYSELGWRVRLILAPPQWAIERKAGTKSTNWTGVSYCTSRTALSRCWREKTGRMAPDYFGKLPINAAAMAGEMEKDK